VIAGAQGSILNSDSAAAIRRSRSRGGPLRPVVPTHPPGKLVDKVFGPHSPADACTNGSGGAVLVHAVGRYRSPPLPSR